MPLSEIQAALPLLAQLLLIAVIGALLVGFIFSIIAFCLRHALAIIGIVAIVVMLTGVQLVP